MDAIPTRSPSFTRIGGKKYFLVVNAPCTTSINNPSPEPKHDYRVEMLLNIGKQKDESLKS